MIEKLPTLAVLVKQLQQVPYLASKNLYRVVNYLLTLEPAKAEQLCNAILQAKQHITKCATCCVWQEKLRDCLFCANIKRDQQTICVVETWQELLSIEKTDGYQGVYHVLGGAIYPLDGIGPEDLTIDVLVKRVEKHLVKEIILATNQTPEGEATAAYIANQLKDKDIHISCLARGVPVGSLLEFMDKLTVYKALSDRRPF